VSTARPLRLKTETAKRSEKSVAAVNPIAKVWVDNSVSHLDGLFDYLIPERFDTEAKVGVRISVDFAGREVEALIVERTALGTVAGLKFITKVLSGTLVVPSGLIELIQAGCQRWLAHPYDFLRSAVPPRVASVDKTVSLSPNSKRGRGKASKSFIHLQPHEDAMAKLAEFALKKVSAGSVLIITPEDRELQLLAKHLGDAACVLSASLNRTDRYANYLRSINTKQQITIGTRSAIFAFPPDLQTLVVYREGAQSHYEPRTPGWNTRDLALIRAEQSGCDLFFAGYAPALETAALAESGDLKILSKGNRVKVINFESANGELLPGRIFTPIRSALKTGPVLFVVPRKGYASSLMCKKCRNIAKCECGGKLSRRSANAPPECVHCSKGYSAFRCRWCKQDVMILLGRGGERHLEEIGRAFSGFPTFFSSAESPIANLERKPALVIATPGMEPHIVGGYSAVVLLDGDSFFSYSDFRAQERAREVFFSAAALSSVAGTVITIIDSSNPISAALAQWNPKVMLSRELTELREVSFPPFARSVVLEVESSEATLIVAGLKKAILDGRAPSSTKVLGPAQRSGSTARILLLAQIKDSDNLLKFISEYNRHRAIAKKKSISLRVDPYSLS
jgi:primosomal protein N' (replication factor Y)